MLQLAVECDAELVRLVSSMRTWYRSVDGVHHNVKSTTPGNLRVLSLEGFGITSALYFSNK